MALTSDINFVDMFLNRDDPFLNSDDSSKSNEDEGDQEMDWLNDEFFDSILKTNCFVSPLKLPDSDILSDKASENIEAVKCITHHSSDNDNMNFGDGFQHGINMAEYGLNMESDNHGRNEISYSSDECINANGQMVECQEISLLNDDTVVISDYECVEVDRKNTKGPFVSGVRRDNKRFLMKKSSKVVGCKRRAKNTFRSRKNHNKRGDTSDEAVSDDDSDAGAYPKLNLTAEEIKLMIREGIALPTHYPLTKSEEKDLKRIRRKIRNKISAQDSRRRKKEYVDRLEERIKQYAEENERLYNCMKQLKTQNVALASQIGKLQDSVDSNKNVAQPTQPLTACLLLLLLSLALVLAPVTHNNASPNTSAAQDETVALSDGDNLADLAGSENLLYAETGLADEIYPKIVEDVNKQETEFGKLDVLQRQNMTLFKQVNNDDLVYTEHNYSRSKKRTAPSSIGSDSDDLWPTPPHSPKLHKSNNLQQPTIVYSGANDGVNKTANERSLDGHSIIFDMLQ